MDNEIRPLTSLSHDELIARIEQYQVLLECYGQPAMPADAMTAVADRYAHRMAMHLECILLDYSGKWADEAMQTLCDYRDAMNAIHEAESPTYMGEPVIARRRIEGE